MFSVTRFPVQPLRVGRKGRESSENASKGENITNNKTPDFPYQRDLRKLCVFLR